MIALWPSLSNCRIQHLLMISKQTWAPVVENISFSCKIIFSTITITRFVTVAILIFFRPAHLLRFIHIWSVLINLFVTYYFLIKLMHHPHEMTLHVSLLKQNMLGIQSTASHIDKTRKMCPEVNDSWYTLRKTFPDLLLNMYLPLKIKQEWMMMTLTDKCKSFKRL